MTKFGGTKWEIYRKGKNMSKFESAAMQGFSK